MKPHLTTASKSEENLVLARQIAVSLDTQDGKNLYTYFLNEYTLHMAQLTHFPPPPSFIPQFALFNFQSFLLALLLLICTCTYAHYVFPGIMDRNRDGSVPTFYKLPYLPG